MGPSRRQVTTSSFLNLAPTPLVASHPPKQRSPRNPPRRSWRAGFLWRVAVLSIITCVVAVKTGAHDLVGQVFGLLGVVCCVAAYKGTRVAPRVVQERSPRDALARTIRMGVVKAHEPAPRRRSA